MKLLGLGFSIAVLLDASIVRMLLVPATMELLGARNWWLPRWLWPRTPIYLDHNATTPVHPAVVDAMLPYLREHFGNPSSSHVFGQRARQAVERAREQVAALLSCRRDEILFTSGGTEANNLAIRGVLELSATRRHVVTSPRSSTRPRRGRAGCSNARASR